MEFSVDLLEEQSTILNLFVRAEGLKSFEHAALDGACGALVVPSTERRGRRTGESESRCDVKPAIGDVEHEWRGAGPGLEHPRDHPLQLLHHLRFLVRHSDQLRPYQRANLPRTHRQVALLSKLRHDVQNALYNAIQ